MNMEDKNQEKQKEKEKENLSKRKIIYEEMERMTRMKKEMERNERLEKKISELTNRIEEYEKTVQSQITSVQAELPTAAREPFFVVCAYKQRWEQYAAYITYDHATIEDWTDDYGGNMNFRTGKFEADTPGFY